MMHQTRQLGLWMAVWLAAGAASGAIYADFSTSLGTFTVELDALNAPRAVANFMGLADGTQTWRDPVTGVARGGAAGDAFYDGLQFYSTVGGFALLGGLRPYSGSDGHEYWEGPGYTILDETTNGEGLVRGVLAMPEFKGPHSGGGELALLLTNAPDLSSGWTGFGAVTGAGMAVVQAVVNSVTGGSGRVVAQIAIRDEEMTPAETAALTAAQAELPIVEAMPLGFSRESNVTTRASFWSAAKSRACLSAISNLPVGAWSVLPGDWNTGTNEVWMDIPLAFIPGVATQLGFLYGSQAVYPKMTASLFPEKMRLGAVHTEMDMQYWLDFAGGTGMWARVEGGVPVQNGTVDYVGQGLETANSVHLVIFIGWTAYHYWLGFDEAGATSGRFYCEWWFMNAELSGTDNGTFAFEEGWGSKKSAQPAWSRVVKATPAPRKDPPAMRSMAEWETLRASQKRADVERGGRN
ncbi:MAG: peptidylprolyl isomerase [Spartobacteria bacterium]|nr:peptidylprolyl isomerase [Spartobacteria bacterium]